MEAGEETSGNSNLKRQRAPLSDSEDNVPSASEVNDGQKRRRLEAAGQENRSPKPSTSGRQAELNAKPDTPMLPSVRSRVQQLTQRRDDEGEFNQRKERFKVPVFEASPGPTPSPQPCPRTCSTFVSGIQQKLQSSTTPSTMQASRMRQEREQELSQLQFQSIRENMWLKRSSSDSALTQGRTPPGLLSPSWVPSSRGRVPMPPVQPWDDGDGDDEMGNGSFMEASVTGTEKQASDGTGAKSPCDPVTSAASGKLENSNEVQLPVEWKQSARQAEEGTGEVEPTASVVNEEKQLMSQVSKLQIVLKLPLSKDESFFRATVGDNHNVSEASPGNEQSELQSTFSEEANLKETSDIVKISEQDVSRDKISFEETKEMDDYSYDEEGIEPSTEEELKLWRYPQDKVIREEEGSILAEEQEEQEAPRPEEDELESEKCSGDSGGYWSTLNRDQRSIEEECCEGPVSGDDDMKDDLCLQSKETQTADKNQEAIDAELDTRSPHNRVKQTELSPFADDVQLNIKNVAKPELEDQARSSHLDGSDGVECLAEVKVSDQTLEAKDKEKDAVDERQRVVDRPTEQTLKAEGGESSKKVTFILEPELINDSSLSETSASMESRAVSESDTELSSQDETNTAEMIDQMFEEVLEYAGRMEEEEEERAEDSGVSACSVDKVKTDLESEKEKSAEEEEEEEEAKEGEHGESETLESNGDELLTFPPSGILSPLSKSVEAVVTPLRLAVSQESSPPSLLLTPEEAASHPAESAPLYSIDAYRMQNQRKLPTVQSVTPGPQRRAPHKSQPEAPVNSKEKISALNEEAGKLQTVINQTLQALSCCTDEEHGRGSLEEAEAEKLLLVSCEKRSALLAEVARLREERGSTSEGEDLDHVSQQPCRGTISITNIQLPLKVEFVCSSRNRTGRPSHYFFILIRYGPCNIVATPLATAADAQNGDTISFPTAITLKDIRSSFEIDVEVYSLSHTSGSSCSTDRTTTKSRVTPRKLLNTITRSSHSVTSAALPALSARRSSNFCMVGSHKITLASLGHSKFPLDKMKLEGKIRRLLGDEFQEKVPFLSPLEGNVYLQLSSQSHSNVQHQGFLTMFELINGYGVWHRRFFVLEGCKMYYWNHPNDRETKEAEGNISLSSSYSRCVRPVKRDTCARPFTFELVSDVPQQQADSQEAFAKCWFSADTKQERLDWMDKLNQALLDFHTWKRTSAAGTVSQPSSSSSGGKLRESIL